MTIPIPKRESGVLLGAVNADVKIDLFVDIQCPHSKAIWPQILDVLAHYKNESLSIRLHLITLSNHRQAWDMSLGIFALAKGNAQQYFDFVTYLYERQSLFYNNVFLHKTHEDLKQLVAATAHDFAGVDKETFIQQMAASDVYELARTPIRYSATKSVWGTPTIFINNSNNAPLSHQSSLEDWQALIDPLLSV
ncbi:DsbA family protein [Agaribacter marinus]|uniref:Thioredoxin-like fold domain-containing protein n=1 Tax=Agaribacter marinus TaxID=1431249 RepID=A0AA37WG70_9ALTE|nr:thioredoxin domain-containing protein [Agaribacter marinus]GLR69781.1 hypothetical protein GCM10007852_06890 [Agaribacter marinus]